jgi:transcriptional regulator with XRE-family HTH domain
MPVPDPLLVTCKARRLKLGIGVQQAADDLNKSPSTIGGWERGLRVPPLPEAREYAEYLGLIVVGLPAGGDDDEPGCEIVGEPAGNTPDRFR